jgi:hypothetical protein
LIDRAGVIEGRGACHHPDGVVRFVRSALNVFRDDLAHHVAGNACTGATSPSHYATVPTIERAEELIWE